MTKRTKKSAGFAYSGLGALPIDALIDALCFTSSDVDELYVQYIDGDPRYQHQEWLLLNVRELSLGGYKLSLKRRGTSRDTLQIPPSPKGSLCLFSAFHAVGRDVSGRRFLLYCKTPANYSN